jgi:DNA-binding transcriptional ArsR family regulator
VSADRKTFERQKGRLRDSSPHSDPGNALSPEARKAARKRTAAWLKAVEAAARDKKLKDLDCRVAGVMTNYPSANRGKCWAGIERLADQIGRSERTIRYAIDRLAEAGLLLVRRGGQGWTNTYTFLIDGKEVFGATSEPEIVAFDRQRLADQERQRLADKPSEVEPFEESLPPQAPQTAPSGKIVQLSDVVHANKAERNDRNHAPIDQEVIELADSCLVAIGIDPSSVPPGWGGLHYDMQVLTKRGCDPSLTRAAFAQFSGMSPLPRKNYVLRAVETAHAKDHSQFAARGSPTRSQTSACPADTLARKVFVAEDSDSWDAWCAEYRKNGGPNGLRVAPRAYDLAEGRGRYFPTERPAASTDAPPSWSQKRADGDGAHGGAAGGENRIP